MSWRACPGVVESGPAVAERTRTATIPSAKAGARSRRRTVRSRCRRGSAVRPDPLGPVGLEDAEEDEGGDVVGAGACGGEEVVEPITLASYVK